MTASRPPALWIASRYDPGAATALALGHPFTPPGSTGRPTNAIKAFTGSFLLDLPLADGWSRFGDFNSPPMFASLTVFVSLTEPWTDHTGEVKDIERVVLKPHCQSVARR